MSTVPNPLLDDLVRRLLADAEEFPGLEHAAFRMDVPTWPEVPLRDPQPGGPATTLGVPLADWPADLVPSPIGGGVRQVPLDDQWLELGTDLVQAVYYGPVEFKNDVNLVARSRESPES